jgi:hypothetical protein
MSSTLCIVAFNLKLVALDSDLPRFTTKQFLTGLTDRYSPLKSTWRPGKPKVVRSVANPVSACAGVVSFKLSLLSLSYFTTDLLLGKYMIERKVDSESRSNQDLKKSRGLPSPIAIRLANFIPILSLSLY